MRWASRDIPPGLIVIAFIAVAIALFDVIATVVSQASWSVWRVVGLCLIPILLVALVVWQLRGTGHKK
jgi:hypothetical protein